MRSLSRSLSTTAALAVACGLSFSAAPGVSQDLIKPPAAPAQETQEVEPDAVQALKKMSAFLGTLGVFEVRADTTRDLVTVHGQRVQLGGVTQFRVRRPDGFQIDVATDYMKRRFYFNGKQFTVYAPELGFYATAPAPPTILQTLDVIEDRYGISIPLEDLFRWNDPSSGQVEDLTAAFLVGPAMVDGVATDHYAFREKDRDWEIWIQQGAQPLPRKLVIVDLSDEARPAYVARLTWNLNATVAADTFTFQPGPDAKAIHLAALNQ
jgi:hypothetical protein